MANQEVTIQFEGYENNTATYVVLTNENDEIEEIRDGQSPSDTEEIDIQPIYVDEDDSDDAEMHVLESTVEEVYVEYIDIKSPSDSKHRRAGIRKSRHKEIGEWNIEIPEDIAEDIREPLRPYRMRKAAKGDIEVSKNGVKRRHDGKRWHRLCLVDGCTRVSKKLGKCITHFNGMPIKYDSD